MQLQRRAPAHRGEPREPAPGRERREARRAPPLAWEIGAENGRGTNIQHVALDRAREGRRPQGRAPRDGALPRGLGGAGAGPGLPAAGGAVAVGLLAACLAVLAAVTRRARKAAGGKDAARGSLPATTPRGRPGDSSEV